MRTIYSYLHHLPGGSSVLQCDPLTAMTAVKRGDLGLFTNSQITRILFNISSLGKRAQYILSVIVFVL